MQKLKLVALCIIFQIAFSHLKAQLIDTRTLIIPEAGAGIPYGGAGLNLQLSKAHFGGWLGVGQNLNKFDPSLKPYTMGPAYDVNIGAKYYFKPTNLRFYWLNVGLSYGHVYDYIDLNKPAGTYKTYAKGFAAQLGCDFFIKKRIVLSLDLLTAPHYMLVNRNDLIGAHGLYWAAAAGIGYKFSIPTIDEREDKSYSRRLKREDCFAKVKEPVKGMVQGVCGNALLYKQLDSGRYIFIDINMDSLKLTPNCQDFTIDTTLKGLRVFVARMNTVNDSVCCQLYSSNGAPSGEIWEGVKGRVTVFVNRKNIMRKNKQRYKISASVNGLQILDPVKPNQPPVSISDVVIWDAHSRKFCK
jgi:hypothetical protein